MTATEARKEARGLLSAIDKGADPASGRTDKRGAPTVEDLADRYFKEHAEPHKRASSVASDKRLNKAHIEKRWAPSRLPTLRAPTWPRCTMPCARRLTRRTGRWRCCQR